MIGPDFTNANILIVDDKQSNIDILVGLLEYQGYASIKTTSDPRTVVRLVGSFNPDLILLDLMMPHLNGYEVMKQLKELIPVQTYLPVLVLTADITAEARQRALAGGASDFLAKPFDLIEVGLRIRNLLYARNLHQQLHNQNQVLEEKVRERTLELEKFNTELEHRVAERTSQLEAANKALEAFSYSVSHDLRAPLRYISGFIEMLMEMKTAERTEEELRYMNIIANGAVDMGKLIEALLSFSRLTRTPLRKTTINTLAMVNQVITFFEQETKNRNITFKIGQIHDSEGDEQLMKQVWVNLISNAIKYTGKKTDAIIEIGSSKQDHGITYFVKDNGAGFDMKHAGKLFAVFQRLHKTNDFEGIGIGLANVSSIISRHGGQCRAEGEMGVGATFFFSLPI